MNKTVYVSEERRMAAYGCDLENLVYGDPGVRQATARCIKERIKN